MNKRQMNLYDTLIDRINFVKSMVFSPSGDYDARAIDNWIRRTIEYLDKLVGSYEGERPMTKKEYLTIRNNPTMIKIKYQSGYSSGEIIIDRMYYLKIQKEFTRVMKDVTILSWEEVGKEKESDLGK